MSQTPGRVTRSMTRPATNPPASVASGTSGRTRARISRAGPLPALGTRQSHSYGAPGKVKLATQIAQGNDELADAFTSTRTAGLERDQGKMTTDASVAEPQLSEEDELSEEEAPAAEPVAKNSSKGSNRSFKPTTSDKGKARANDVADIRKNPSAKSPSAKPTSAKPTSANDPDDSGDDTSIATPPSHQQHTVTITDAVHLYKTRPTRGPGSVPPTEAEVEVARPWTARLTVATLLQCFLYPFQHLHEHFWDILLFCTMIGLLFTTFGPAGDWIADKRTQVWGGVFNIGNTGIPRSTAVVVDNKLYQRVSRLETDLLTTTAVVDKQLYQRVSRLEADVHQLQGQTGLHEASIHVLNDIIPHTLAVKENVNGKYEIPETFWLALKEKMQYDYDLLHNKPVAPEDPTPTWERFLNINSAKVQALVQDNIEDALNHAVASEHIISHTTFIELIAENNRRFQEESNMRTQSHMQEYFETQAAALTSDIYSTVPSIAEHFAELAASDVVARMPGYSLGQAQGHLKQLAAANLLSNSEIALKSVNWFSPGLGAVINPRLTSPTQLPPRWFWGKRLYTSLPLPWAPRPAAPIAALTRWEEATDCWCAAPSTTAKAQLAVLIPRRIYPTRLVVEHIPALGTPNIAAAPRQLELWAQIDTPAAIARVTSYFASWPIPACGPQPAPGMLCLGRITYDIHGSNHVQVFPIPLDLAAAGVAVNQLVVRAVSNWGADWTCIYRFRLNGIDAVLSGVPPYDDA